MRKTGAMKNGRVIGSMRIIKMTGGKVYRTLYGSASDNTCAFCCKHFLSLTPRQLKTRKCLQRQCRYLIRHEHRFWDERDTRKAMRKARKRRLEEKYAAVTGKKGVS